MAAHMITNKNFLEKHVDFIKTIRVAFDITLKEAAFIAAQFPRPYTNFELHEKRILVAGLPSRVASEEYFRQIDGIWQGESSTVNFEPAISVTEELKKIAKIAIDQDDYDMSIEIIQILR